MSRNFEYSYSSSGSNRSHGDLKRDTPSTPQEEVVEKGRRVVLPKLLEEHFCWLKLAGLVFFFLEEIFRDLLHKTGKLSHNPKELFTELCKNKHRVESLLKRQKITQHQYDLIYPRNKKTETWRFDITTFVFIVRYFTTIKPRGGWRLVNKLERGDKSKGAILIELEHFMTENIEGSEPIKEYCFDELWSHICYFLRGFKCDLSQVAELKRCTFVNGTAPEKYWRCLMKAQALYLSDYQKQINRDLIILQYEDEQFENKEDITKLLEESKATGQMVLHFAEQVQSGHLMGTDLYSRMSDINKRLEQSETEMKFLKQMITFEKTAEKCTISTPHEDGVTGRGYGGVADTTTEYEESVDASFERTEPSKYFRKISTQFIQLHNLIVKYF